MENNWSPVRQANAKAPPRHSPLWQSWQTPLWWFPAWKLCLCASLDSFVAMQTWCSNTAAVNAAWSNTIAGYLAWCLGCPPDPEINESRKCLRNYLQAWPFQSRRPLLQHDAQDSRGTFFDSLGMLLVRPSRMFIDPVANPRRRQLCIPDF